MKDINVCVNPQNDKSNRCQRHLIQIQNSRYQKFTDQRKKERITDSSNKNLCRKISVTCLYIF